MGRRYDHSRDELVEMAYQATEDLVKTKGYKEFSMRRIADAMGYAVGTLYTLFENADDLVIRVNGRTLEKLHQHLTLTEQTPAYQENGPQALTLAYLAFARENYNLWSMIFEHPTPPMGRPDWYNQLSQTNLKHLYVSLLPYMKGHEPYYMYQSTRALWSGIHGICTLSLTNKLIGTEAEGPEKLIILLVENFINGLRAA